MKKIKYFDYLILDDYKTFDNPIQKEKTKKKNNAVNKRVFDISTMVLLSKIQIFKNFTPQITP